MWIVRELNDISVWLWMGIMWAIQHLFNIDSRNIYHASSVCQAPEIQPSSRQTTVPLGDSILAQRKWHHSDGKHWEQPLSPDLALENILCCIMILNEKSTWATHPCCTHLTGPLQVLPDFRKLGLGGWMGRSRQTTPLRMMLLSPGCWYPLCG